MSRSRNLALALAGLMAITLIGCGGSDPEPDVAEEAARAEPVSDPVEPDAPEPEVAEPAEPETSKPVEAATTAPTGKAGAVIGSVKFTGDKIPKRRAVPMGADPKCVEMHDTKVGTQNLLINEETKAIRNVFVYVSKGLEGRTFQSPSEAAAITQRGCMYVPHVQGMMTGQELKIRSEDETMHNVHCLAKTNREFNFAMSGPGERMKSFRKSETPIKFKCDVHPWMSAYVFVLDHPFFGKTNRAGEFSIEGLSPGKYTLTAWHEELGEQTREIEVSADAGASANFEFSN